MRVHPGAEGESGRPSGLLRVWFIHCAAAGRREACLMRSHSVTMSCASLSCKNRWLLMARSWASLSEQLLIRKGARKMQILQARVKTSF